MKFGLVSVKQRWFVSEAGEYLFGRVNGARLGEGRGRSFRCILHRSSNRLLLPEELVGRREGFELELELRESEVEWWGLWSLATGGLLAAGLWPQFRLLAAGLWL